jgi:hypothetical protein
VKKWKAAEVGVKATKDALEELTSSNRLKKEWIADWTKQEEKAMKERGDSLNIYDVSVGKGLLRSFCQPTSTEH